MKNSLTVSLQIWRHLVWLVLFVPSWAVACSCMQVSDEVSFCQAHFVIAAKIKQVQGIEEEVPQDVKMVRRELQLVRYEVVKSYKGAPTLNGMFLSDKYGASCGVDAQEGSIALLKISDNGFVGLCGFNTMKFDPAASEGRALLERFRKIEVRYRRDPQGFCAKQMHSARLKGLIP